MTIELRTGDIFSSDCDVLVDPVNCIGISGAGLALQFKENFPWQQSVYQEVCKGNGLKMGSVLWVVPPHFSEDSVHIVYFPTKLQPKYKSNIRDIYEGLIALRQMIYHYNPDSIAIPALGCGLGELDFDRVRAATEYVFQTYTGSTRIKLYEPQ